MKRLEFWRAIGLLAGSAAIAHGITAAALPLLSRLYSPTDFSALAVFASLASVLSAVAALRYDIAVPLPEEERDALNLLVLAIALAAIIALLVAIGVALGSSWIAAKLDQPSLGRYLWLLPIAVFTAAGCSALQNWYTRHRSFATLAATRIAQSSVAVTTQAGSSFVLAAPAGLLGGYVANSGVGFVVLGARLWREKAAEIRGRVSWRTLHEQAGRYRRFPRYSTFEAILNNGSVHLPILLIAAYAAGPEAGYVALAMMLMQAPMSLIGTAVGQVYLSRAPEEHRRGRLGQMTSETLTQLLRIGVGPLLAVGIVAPMVFEPIFGEGWQRAGYLVSWMTPWFVLQFLAVPIGMALHVTGHQHRALILQAGGFVIRIAAVLVAALWLGGHVAETYALSGAVLYLAYLLVVAKTTGLSVADGRRVLLVSLPYLVAWIFAGTAFALVASRWAAP